MVHAKLNPYFNELYDYSSFNILSQTGNNNYLTFVFCLEIEPISCAKLVNMSVHNNESKLAIDHWACHKYG